MQLTFSPIILACDKVTEACTSLVPPEALKLMAEDQCVAMIQSVLKGLQEANPTVLFMWKCISWGTGV